MLNYAWYIMLFLLVLKWNLYEREFFCVNTKTNSNFTVNLAALLKEATIHFCLFGESHFFERLYILICGD